MKIAILQSNYIPWKGYFDIIRSVDEFIILDDVQYTRRDWRNRNIIKTSQGPKWLTIPVKVKGRYQQRICDTEIHGHGWAEQHWKTIVHSYSKAPHFRDFRDIFEPAYEKASGMKMLSEVNLLFIETICDILGSFLPFTTHISSLPAPRTPHPAPDTPHPIPRTAQPSPIALSDSPHGNKSDRILSICLASGAGVYLTGPAGLGYLNTGEFRKAGIEIVAADYEGYPIYEQQHPPFSHNVTILDLLFNTGPEASYLMKKLL